MVIWLYFLQNHKKNDHTPTYPIVPQIDYFGAWAAAYRKP